MKIKDIERTANVAWSPANQYPILLAAGTAAQQLDASFNTNAALELYSLNLSEPGLDTELKVSTPSSSRFHKVIWGSYGKDHGNGTIVGGCDGGLIQIYNVSKLLSGDNGLVASPDKHTGPVHALDLNPFQGNLLASGATDSEIYIWDLNNTTTPMTPGVKCQPSEDVNGVAWNKQVQHILASTFASKCVVWDLRKNEPIIKLTDTVSRIRWKVVAWHPEIATQLCLASEEDHAPIIQLWDLRFATSPLKSLENHQRGILSVAWCQKDADLLISCAKDDRIICWDPNSNHPNGEVLAEIAKTNQWNFDVAWCPRNPALIACPNYDGHITVYSLLGGKTTQVQTSKKIADSFPGMDGYMEAPLLQESVTSVFSDLSKPPKWFKRPIGATFGFGGKLITFENSATLQNQQQHQGQPAGQGQVIQQRHVFVSQLVTEEDLVHKSTELEQALQYGNYSEYCKNKAESLTDQHKRYIWYFLKAYFEENTRGELLNLLGYKAEDINSRLSQFTHSNDLNNDIDGLSDQLSNINKPSPGGITALNQNNAIPGRKMSGTPFKINTGDDTDGLITQALLLGNTEAAVELCFRAKRYADAIIIAMTGGPELLARTQYRYFEKSEGYVSSLISAIVSEDWSSITSGCDVASWKEALVAVLTHASNEDLPILCEQLANRLEEESRGDPKLSKDAQLCFICAGDFEKLVASWSDLAHKSTDNLQELVELVTFLQKAVERQGRSVEITGNLADVLSRYAMLLASQGRLSTALNYLGVSQDEKITDLRDRLHVALGKRSLQSTQRPSRQSISGYTKNPQGFGSYNNVPTPNQFPSSAVNAAPLTNYNQFNTGLPNSAANQPWQPQGVPSSVPAQTLLPRAFSPGPPQQPPRPGSVGSAHGDSGIRSRSKYVLDPSVKPSNSYMASNSFGTSNPAASPLFNAGNFQTDALANANSSSLYGQPPFYSTSGSAPQNLRSSPPMAPVSSNSYNAPPISTQPTFQNIGGAGDQLYGQVEVGQPAISAMNSLPPSSAPGWNDPPVVNRPPRAQPKKTELPKQNPITHPLYGSAPVPEHLPTGNAFLNSSSSQFQNSYGSTPAVSQPYSSPLPPNIYQNPEPSFFNPSQPHAVEPLPNRQAVEPLPNRQVVEPLPNRQVAEPLPNRQVVEPLPNRQPFLPQQQQQQAPVVSAQPFVAPTSGFNTQPIGQGSFNRNATYGVQQKPLVAEVVPVYPEPVQKPPVPEEHRQMQVVLDELRNRCLRVANNPQTKRKLEEVARKLEVLYDLLRDQNLSAGTLESLHELIRLVEAGDYMGGLQLHTQLVSGPDFAQIAGFMPGLKVLVQCAIQLQVYMR